MQSPFSQRDDLASPFNNKIRRNSEEILNFDTQEDKNGENDDSFLSNQDSPINVLRSSSDADSAGPSPFYADRKNSNKDSTDSDR